MLAGCTQQNLQSLLLKPFSSWQPACVLYLLLKPFSSWQPACALYLLLKPFSWQPACVLYLLLKHFALLVWQTACVYCTLRAGEFLPLYPLPCNKLPAWETEACPACQSASR
jgi:hypothetical protein